MYSMISTSHLPIVGLVLFCLDSFHLFSVIVCFIFFLGGSVLMDEKDYGHIPDTNLFSNFSISDLFPT